jgi:hypothetical protein
MRCLSVALLFLFLAGFVSVTYPVNSASGLSPLTLLRNGNQDFVVDPRRPLVYSAVSDYVSIVNTTTGETFANVVVGAGPSSIDLSSDGVRLYVALSKDTKIAVVDIGSRSVLRTIELGFAPWSVRHARPGRLIVSGASDSLVHLVNETSGTTLATVRPYLSLAIVETSPDGRAFLVIDMGIDPVKIQRFRITNDTPIFEAVDGHNLGINFQEEAVDWSHGVMYLASGGSSPYGLEMVSVSTLARLGVLPMAPYPILTTLAPDMKTVYGVTDGNGNGPVLWGFNTTSQEPLGSMSLPNLPQYIGVPIDEKGVLTAWPIQRVSIRPSVVPRSPLSGAALSYSPAYVEAWVRRGIGSTGISALAVAVDGISLEARLSASDVLRGDLRFTLPDRHLVTVVASFSSGADAFSVTWNFTVDSLIPIPGVNFTSFEYRSGFRIPVPTDWLLEQDRVISGTSFDLVLYGPTGAVARAVIIVTAGQDPSVRENSSYLQGVMDTFVGNVTQTNPGTQVVEGPIFRTLSNRSAVTFAVRLPNHLVQKVTLVVSEPHQTFWLMLLTVGEDQYPAVNPIYEHMIHGFAITAGPPTNPGGVLWTLLFLALVIGFIASSILILRAVRKSRSGTGAPPIYLSSQGQLNVPADQGNYVKEENVEAINYPGASELRASARPTGITITCHRRFGQFLITNQPSLIAGTTKVMSLRWGEPVFVPLPAGVTHQLVIQFLYIGTACGIAEFSAELQDGEIQAFVYRAPFIVYFSGRITKT